MTDEFSTFVLSETTVNQINALPDTMQLKYYKAVADYGLNGIEPDFIGMELAVWISMRDLILHTKRKDEKWRQKQQENGKKGGRPKTQNNPDEPKKPTETQNNPDEPKKPTETQNNPDDNWVNTETHNDNNNDNGNDKDNEFTPTACAVDQKEIIPVSPKNKIAPVSQPPPKKRGSVLTDEQKPLFHAAKACFESSERAKAIMYQDRGSTQMHMENLKLFVVRCQNMAPEITADFMRNVLEHFKTIINGKLKGRAEFTPRALITPWIWEMVIGTLPEADDELTEKIRASIKGMFQ